MTERSGAIKSYQVIGLTVVAVMAAVSWVADALALLDSNRTRWERAAMFVAVAVIVAAVIGWLRHKRVLTGERLIRLIPFVLVGCVAYVVVQGVIWKRAVDAGIEVTVHNATVLDASGRTMEWPAEQEYLTTETRNCGKDVCGVPGSRPRTGDVVRAHCRTEGQEIFNYDEKVDGAVRWPGADSSTTYYRVTDSGNRTGFLNTIWIDEKDRETDLPTC